MISYAGADELIQLRAWQGPAPSTRPTPWCALLATLTVAAAFIAPSLGVLGAILLAARLGRLRHRACATPPQAVRHFFACVAAADYDEARRALVDIPRGEGRRVALDDFWRVKLGFGRLWSASVVEVELLADDAGRVTVDLAYSISRERVVKLVVRRGARWYLVSGLPDDDVDHVLLEHWL